MCVCVCGRGAVFVCESVGGGDGGREGGGKRREGKERRRGRGRRFRASVPLPFMLGLTYMHPSPTIKH